MEVNRFYYGNGKKRFKIEKILNASNICKENKEFILKELDDISKSAQNANELYIQLKNLIK